MRYAMLSVLALLVGSLVGAGLVWGPRAAEPKAMDSTRTSSSPAVAPPPCAARQVHQMQATEVAITELRAKLRAMRAEEIEIIGEPLPFPEDLPHRYSSEGAEATLSTALEGTPFWIAGMSCEEYPCIALVRWRSDSSPELDLYDVLERAGVGASVPGIGGYREASGETYSQGTVMLHPSVPTGPSYDRRRGYRFGLLQQQIAAESEAAP